MCWLNETSSSQCVDEPFLKADARLGAEFFRQDHLRATMILWYTFYEYTMRFFAFFTHISR